MVSRIAVLVELEHACAALGSTGRLLLHDVSLKHNMKAHPVRADASKPADGLALDMIPAALKEESALPLHAAEERMRLEPRQAVEDQGHLRAWLLSTDSTTQTANGTTAPP